MSFEPLKRILPQVVRSHGITKQVEARRVLEEAGRVMRALWGEEKFAYLNPISFSCGVLKISSTSAAALQQIKLDELRILNEINRKLGGKIVTRLDARSKGF